MDGLAAMAEGIDVDVRLAQIMSEMDQTSVDDLQGMFDVVNSRKENDESAYGVYRKMLTYKELMGNEAKGMKVDIFDVLSSFSSTDVFSAFRGFTANAAVSGTEKSSDKEKTVESVVNTQVAVPADLLIPDMSVRVKKRKKSGKISIPTRTLFDVV